MHYTAPLQTSRLPCLHRPVTKSVTIQAHSCAVPFLLPSRTCQHHQAAANSVSFFTKPSKRTITHVVYHPCFSLLAAPCTLRGVRLLAASWHCSLQSSSACSFGWDLLCLERMPSFCHCPSCLLVIALCVSSCYCANAGWHWQQDLMMKSTSRRRTGPG